MSLLTVTIAARKVMQWLAAGCREAQGARVAVRTEGRGDSRRASPPCPEDR
jgi:hypothetical protein